MLCYGLYSTYIPLVGLLKSLSQMILDTSPEVTLQALDVIRSENVQVIKDNSSLSKDYLKDFDFLSVCTKRNLLHLQWRCIISHTFQYMKFLFLKFLARCSLSIRVNLAYMKFINSFMTDMTALRGSLRIMIYIYIIMKQTEGVFSTVRVFSFKHT